MNYYPSCLNDLIEFLMNFVGSYIKEDMSNIQRLAQTFKKLKKMFEEGLKATWTFWVLLKLYQALLHHRESSSMLWNASSAHIISTYKNIFALPFSYPELSYFFFTLFLLFLWQIGRNYKIIIICYLVKILDVVQG